MSFAINTDALAKLDAAFDYALQAKQNERAGKSSVIRINGENFSCQVSHADAPRGILSLFSFRKSDQKALNNATRALFKQTVLDAFGVTDENALPQSVKKAMRLSKYDNTGRPLTARRIIAVATAIRSEVSCVDAAIKNCIARNKSVIKEHPNDNTPKFEITPEMRKTAIDLLYTHCKGLTPKARQVIANYTLFTLSNPTLEDDAESVVTMLANKIGTLDDFKYGDKRFSPLNDKLTEVYQDKLDFYMTPECAEAFVDGVSETLYKDAYRAAFEFSGKDPNAGLATKDVEGRKTAVVSKFKDSVPEKFWKPLSMFMCQDMGRVLGELLPDRLAMQSTGDMVVGSDYKGGELMPFSPKDGEVFNEMTGLTGKGEGIKYRFEISDDKKTATITMESSFNLKFCLENASYDGNNICGKVNFSEQFKFDLSGDQLKMTSHYTSQNIEP